MLKMSTRVDTKEKVASRVGKLVRSKKCAMKQKYELNYFDKSISQRNNTKEMNRLIRGIFILIS